MVAHRLMLVHLMRIKQINRKVAKNSAIKIKLFMAGYGLCDYKKLSYTELKELI